MSFCVVATALLAPLSLSMHGAVRFPISNGVHHCRAPPPMQFFGGSGNLPSEIEELLDPTMPPGQVVPLWKELRKCYPTEAEAIAAAKKQPLVILPFINTPDNIRFNMQILCEEVGFSKEERMDIITKNPGVLANKARPPQAPSRPLWAASYLPLPCFLNMLPLAKLTQEIAGFEPRSNHTARRAGAHFPGRDPHVRWARDECGEDTRGDPTCHPYRYGARHHRRHRQPVD